MTIDWTDEAVWAGTRQPLARATGLDPAAYTDAGFHQLERERVFERAWVTVGTAPEVTEPGRLLVRRAGRRSILISRDDEGTLHAFVNSCRHRGTELAAADGPVGGIIRCPYHRWGYGLDGRLIAAPLFDEVPRGDFDPDDLGLVPVRVDIWGVLLFVCLDPETPPLRDWLGDLPERMSGYGLERWWGHEQRSIDVSANWKLISENFQEYYHLGWVHPELAKVSRVKDHYRYQGPGMYCGQTTTPVSDDDRDNWLILPPADGLDESDGCSGRFVAVFPNALLAVLPSHAFVIRLDPTDVGTTTEVCTFLLPPSSADVDEAAFTATRSFWFDVNDEDIGIVERSQRGLEGGGVPAGPLAPRFEEPLHRFHNMVADCMTSDSLAAGLTIPGGDGPDTAARCGVGVNPRPPAIDRADVQGGE